MSVVGEIEIPSQNQPLLLFAVGIVISYDSGKANH